jgi:predicted phage terminase large subunit-like protein
VSLQILTSGGAAQELIRREDAAKSLAAFIRYVNPSFQFSWHHYEICRAVERHVNGEVDRSTIEAPPRHSKSEIISVMLPAWYLGKFPDRQVMAVSYADELATGFGRRVRNLIASDVYQNVFPGVALSQDSKAANRWHTNHGGCYHALGIGGAATGKGAHLLLVDDPFKNREEADSQTIRDKVWSIFESDLQSRLMPGGSIIVMNTRWHEDDLVGRLDERAKNGEGDSYTKVTFPAILDEYTPQERSLWEAWFPIEVMRRRRKNTEPRTWSALYQQRPQPASGGYFKREWFRRFNLGDQPKYLHKYIFSDYAVSDGKGDFTEHGVWGMDVDDNAWAVDWWFGQTPSDQWIESLIDLGQKHKPFALFGEAGVIQKAIEPMLIKRQRERNAFFRNEFIPSINDKPTRARGFQGRAASGYIYIPKCEWGDRVISQCVNFPAGRHDDAVDVCSSMGMALDMTHPAIIPLQKQPTNQDRYAKAFEKARRGGSGSNSWRTA